MMAANARVPSFAWRMQVSAASEGVGEIYIYDDITAYESWWDDSGITPKKFKEDLDALGPVSLLKVFINSNGGDVFAGQAIHSMISRHQAEVHVYIDGLAASIASVIAMAGDKVIMPANAMMMIHNPWRTIWDWIAGNADYFRQLAEEMKKLADDLDQIRESLIAAYMKRYASSREDLIAKLDAETWLTAEQCKELGFCDEIEGAKVLAAALRGNTLTLNGQEFDLSRFRNRPDIAALAAGRRLEPPANRTPDPAVQNAGRVLSTENEGHIRSAHEALGKVLDKLSADDPDAAADDEADGPPAADPPADPAASNIVPPASGPPDDGDGDAKARNVAYLETLRAQIETRRRR